MYWIEYVYFGIVFIRFIGQPVIENTDIIGRSLEGKKEAPILMWKLSLR